MAGVVKIHSHAVAFAQTDLSKTQGLSGVTDWEKCVPWFTRRMHEDNSTDMSDWAEHSFRADVNATPNLVIDRTGAAQNPGDSEYDFQAFVVEYGSGTNVTKVPFTLTEGSDSVTTGSFSVTTANAFVKASYKQASYPGGGNALIAVRVRLNATNITVDREHVTLNCTDMVFAEASGSSVRITSVLGELPDMQVGDKFVITNHPVGANNATYTVTVRTDGENDYTATSDGAPENATAEAADAEVQGPQIDGVAYVVESPGGADWTVQHITGTLSGSTVDITIPSTVTVGKSFLLSTYYHVSDLTDNNNAAPYMRIFDGDNVRALRSSSANSVEISCQVVTLTGSASVQRGTVISASPADEDADVADVVWGTFSGGAVTITSAGANFPAWSAGQEFWIDQHTGSENDGLYTLDTATSSSSWDVTRSAGAGTDSLGPIDSDLESQINAAVNHPRQTDAPVVVDITDVDTTKAIAWVPGPQSGRCSSAPGVSQTGIGDTFYMAELINSGADARISRGRVGAQRATESGWEVIEWELDGAGPPGRRVMVR